MALTLYRFPGSHYCERAEMLLHLKGVPYERRTLGYVESARVLPKETGDDTVPALKADDGTVVLWRDIPRWLEERHPTPRIYPEDEAQRDDVERWEESADLVLGHAVRRLGYWELKEDSAQRRRFFRVKNPVDEATSITLLAVLMRRYGATAWQRALDEAFLAAFLARMERALGRTKSGHLVGASLSAADVAVAALLAPIAGSKTAKRAGHPEAWAWAEAMRAQLKPKRPEPATTPRAP